MVSVSVPLFALDFIGECKEDKSPSFLLIFRRGFFVEGDNLYEITAWHDTKYPHVKSELKDKAIKKENNNNDIFKVDLFFRNILSSISNAIVIFYSYYCYFCSTPPKPTTEANSEM